MNKLINFFNNLFKEKPKYEYGTIEIQVEHGFNGKKRLSARKEIKTGNVEFMMWKAGENGHTEPYYTRVGIGIETTFRKDIDKDEYYPKSKK